MYKSSISYISPAFVLMYFIFLIPFLIIEIDAASNRGIQDAKDLIAQVQYAPINGKYKIFIIDEVHMLTPEAFNALLKTLEEPPKNVIFILATTEPHKVLETIVSRCQRFDLRRITTDDITKRLREISDIEKQKQLNEYILDVTKQIVINLRVGVIENKINTEINYR